MSKQQELKFSHRKTKPKAKVQRPKRYKRLEKPRHPVKNGLFAAKAQAKGEKTLGRFCIACKARLKYKSGRPPVVCPNKPACFRAYRNMYRRDYDRAAA
jgi:hypothetical protein